MEYFQYVFTGITTEQKEMLIALLSEIGFHGFEENEVELLAFTTHIINKNELDKILQIIPVIYSVSTIDEVNWNEKWEAEFEPVTVLVPGSQKIFANVRAGFHPPEKDALHDIVITPKMSFGTGHHATTYGMIENMYEIDFTNKTVIDFGTGTGILAILAEKMGAEKIIAIDNDDWCIRNAEENIKVNDCNKIGICKTGSLQNIPKADIILANINLNVIISNMQNLITVCNKDATIILSGMLLQDKVITEIIKKYPLTIIKMYERHNWIVITAVH